MLQGPGQRFDFHMSKVLCDLRSVPLFSSCRTFQVSFQNKGNIRHHH